MSRPGLWIGSADAGPVGSDQADPALLGDGSGRLDVQAAGQTPVGADDGESFGVAVFRIAQRPPVPLAEHMVGRHAANVFAPDEFSWQPTAALIMSSDLQMAPLRMDVRTW